jgi:predicted transcriptional regulator
VSSKHLRRGVTLSANSSSYAARVNFQTTKINQIFEKSRRGHRRREPLTLVQDILSNLKPPDQNALEIFWKAKFGHIPIDNLPFEPPTLSKHDIARAVNLQEDRLMKYIHVLTKHYLIIREGDTYSITFKGVLALAKLDNLLNDPLIRPLIEDLERINPGDGSKSKF